MDQKELTVEIKNKKELQGIKTSIVEDELISYLKKTKIDEGRLKDLGKGEIKIIVKEVRSRLRLAHGRFNVTSKDRKKYLENNDFERLLNTHSSTKERLVYYGALNKKVSDLKVYSIMDIGCGLNPIAMAKKGYQYFALDINEDELSILKDYFKFMGIEGHVISIDITRANLSVLPSVDLCILFKILDVIRKMNRSIVKSILQEVKCKYFLASFATRTLSGKRMNNKCRLWFTRILDELNYRFEIFEFDNEIFYFVEKT